jgi:hypothetical protein
VPNFDNRPNHPHCFLLLLTSQLRVLPEKLSFELPSLIAPLLLHAIPHSRSGIVYSSPKCRRVFSIYSNTLLRKKKAIRGVVTQYGLAVFPFSSDELHRVIVCLRSSVISKSCDFKDACAIRDDSGVCRKVEPLAFNFLDDNPQSVDCVVQYFYWDLTMILMIQGHRSLPSINDPIVYMHIHFLARSTLLDSYQYNRYRLH